MLTPRFTLRTVLKGVTICALIALIAGQAVAGQFWALAMIIAIGAAVFFFGVYAASFLLLKLIPVGPPSHDDSSFPTAHGSDASTAFPPRSSR